MPMYLMLLNEGVEGVGFYNFFAGYYQEPTNSLQVGAMDMSRIPVMFPEIEIPQEQVDTMLRTRNGALIGRDRSVRFTVENVRGEPACEGTFTNESTAVGRFSLSCFHGKFSGNGGYDSKFGAPNDHIVARGQTANGLPIVMVIGLPAQLAASTYGGI